MNNQYNIRPIETPYRGVMFRSRLEARWAVFFDALGIIWEYEPEGYELRHGVRYVPDFWLPTFDGGTFVEVKPPGGDFTKARALAAECHHRVWLAEGMPSFDCQQYSVPISIPGGPEWDWGLPNFGDAEFEDRMYYNASWDGNGYDMWGPNWKELYADSLLARAARTACKHRFDW